MEISDDTIFHKIIELGNDEMHYIYTGWVRDSKKLKRLADSDCRDIDDIVRDPITGMMGEWGGYHYVNSHGSPCKQPDCGILERDEHIWSNDLISLLPIKIKTASGEITTVENSVSCKAQLLSRSSELHPPYPSWTFQQPAEDRYGDPILNDPNANILVVVSWINNYQKGSIYPVCIRYPRVAFNRGFRFRLRVTCFWWPEVFSYLDIPVKEDLINKKKCLYFRDIKHLQSRIVTNDIP